MLFTGNELGGSEAGEKRGYLFACQLLVGIIAKLFGLVTFHSIDYLGSLKTYTSIFFHWSSSHTQ